MEKKTALITGASMGIGVELAKCFAQEKYDLILLSRNEDPLRKVGEELKQIYGISYQVLAKDLSLPNVPLEIFQALEKDQIEVDVLVNNAGFGIRGLFDEIPAEDILGMVQVNVTALTQLTYLFLPGMKQRGSGRILQVASTAAFQPGPYMGIYYATKAYVYSLSRALSNELKGTGVSMTVLCPGATDTPFHKRAGLTQPKLSKFRNMKADVVARAGFEGLLKGRPLVIPGLSNRLLAFLVWLFPQRMVLPAVRLINSP